MIPVVDISEHNAPINFATMREAGVVAVIMRVAHGMTLDRQVNAYYPAARAAGYDHNDIGFYSFINPKRGGANETAEFAAENILYITGEDAVMYMLDVENYRDQSPNVGFQPITGNAFAQYIIDHLATFARWSPTTFECGYTNRAYWNSPDGPNSIALAQQLEWIVARYPVYSPKGYALFPVPHDPDEWEHYAFSHADGPFPPIGGTWSAWQFSAGYNKCGAKYGAGSGDLDLNIFKDDAFARMFRPQPVPPPSAGDDDMIRLLAPVDSPARFYAACDSAGRAIRCEWTGDGADPKVDARLNFMRAATPGGTPFEMVLDVAALINVSLDGPLPPGFLPDNFANPDEIRSRMAAGVVDQSARDAAAHANAGVDNIDRRLAATAAHLVEAGEALT